ncbi:peptide chain release factor 1 [Patescibacteria group bacterium]|nr:peptide chain release factor 1 [Patescibacteria group bacterium]
MYEEIKNQFAEIEKKLSDPKLMSNPQEMIKISQKHAAMKNLIQLIAEEEKLKKEIADNKELLSQANDEEFKKMAEDDLKNLEERLVKVSEEIEEERHPQGPNDHKNAIIEIRAGTGGDEAALFAGDLFRMYLRFCERQSWKTEMISSSALGVGGFKEVIFTVKGAGAFGSLKYEAGTHRVQRVPETEKQGRIHTSTATVVVLPEAEEVDISLNMADIRIDTFCSSGPGGQSVNTTYSAIRILHIPTGIIVSCQDQKSQHQNREKALIVLRSRLLSKQEEERMASESSARKDQVGAGDRSDKIRTYNFPQDRLTDHRIGHSWHNLNTILEGDIEDVIKIVKKAFRS